MKNVWKKYNIFFFTIILFFLIMIIQILIIKLALSGKFIEIKLEKSEVSLIEKTIEILEEK